jgi:hypothetical protein
MFVSMLGTIVGPDGLAMPNAVVTVALGEPIGRDFTLDRVLAVADSQSVAMLRGNDALTGAPACVRN